MKNKFLFTTVLFAALSLVFTSCDKEKENEPDDPIKNESGYENGYAYVDLGLPSGLKWATCNVGASKPEEKGDYFAWGETTPKDSFNWGNYKWCTAKYVNGWWYDETFIKYTVDDGKTILEAEDDAASVNMGGKWRMPTQEEIYELITQCEWNIATKNYIIGYEIKGENTASIFLPFGNIYENNEYILNYSYWSSSSYHPSSTYLDYAYALYDDTGDQFEYLNNLSRCCGSLVRAVCK